MPLPTFILAGAPKSGTTALWNYLSTHPEICLPVKEPRFFSTSEGEFSKHYLGSGQLMPGTFSKGLDWYRSLFDSCNESCAIGEASTVYFSDPMSAQLIQQTLPEVRLIFVLRDPVARTYSHYWQEIKFGLELPEFDVLVETQNPRLDYYLHVSRYNERLQAFRNQFSDEQILILTSTELQTVPLETLTKVYRFIGVSDAHKPTSIGKRFNQQQRPLVPGFEKMLRAASVSQVGELFQGKIRTYLGRLKRRLSQLNYVVNEYPALSDYAQSELAKTLQEEMAFFKTLSS